MKLSREKIITTHQGNPYLPLWEYIPDGEPYVFEDPDSPGKYRVYIYGSHDMNKTEYCGKDLVLWSAPVEDLTGWRYDGVIFQSPNGKDYDTLYAPDVVEVVENNQKVYYLYPNNISALRITMAAKASRPDGPFEVINWADETKTNTKGILSFDPAVYADGNGNVYGYWGFADDYNGWVGSYWAKLDPHNMYSLAEGESAHKNIPTWNQMMAENYNPADYNIVQDENTKMWGFFEASSIRKVGNKYVFIYSRNGVDSEPTGKTYNQLGYGYSDSPAGPWKFGGIIVDAAGENIPNGSGDYSRTFNSGNTHGSICEINGQWYIFYHRNLEHYARQAMVEPITVEWDEIAVAEGGTVRISMAEVTSNGFYLDGLNPYIKHSAGIVCYLTGGARIQPDYSQNTTTLPIVDIKNDVVAGIKYFNFEQPTENGKKTHLELELKPLGKEAEIDVYIRPTTAVNTPIIKENGVIRSVGTGSKKIGTFYLKADMPQVLTTMQISVPEVDKIDGQWGVFFVFRCSIMEKNICELYNLQFLSVDNLLEEAFDDVKEVTKEHYYGTSSDYGDGTFNNDAVTDTDTPDPDIIRVGEAYYMVSTSMHFSPGKPIMKSYDLINWEIVNYIYNIITDSDALSLRNGKYDYGCGSWAASLRYREADGKYYACHTSNTTQKTYFYRTDDLEKGTWEQIVCNTWYHDSSMVFVGEDIYIFHGCGEIYVDKMKEDFSGSEWSKTIITAKMTTEIVTAFMNDGNTYNNTFLEATHAYKIGDTFYVFMCGWPTNSNATKTQYVFKSNTVNGDYEGKVIINDKFGRDEGVSQGGIVDMVDGSDQTHGKWMGFFMHRRGAAGRGMVLTPCTFDENGWPLVADSQGKLEWTGRTNVPIKGIFEKTSIVKDTDFNNEIDRPAYTKQVIADNQEGVPEANAYLGSNLPLGFEWNHNPDNRYWSLTERAGYLRLTNGYLTENGIITAAKNILTTRTYGPESWGHIAMEINGMKNGDVAGLASFNRNYGYCAVKMTHGKKYIVYCEATDTSGTYYNQDEWSETILTELDDSISRVYFKLYNDYRTNNNDQAHFYYSIDGNGWVDPDIHREVYFDCPWHFVGSRFAIFNFATEEIGGYVDVDYFKLGDIAPIAAEKRE